MSTAKLLVKVTSTLWLLYSTDEDLCWQCSEKEKSSTIKIAEEHLMIVQMERSYYTSSCEDSSWFVRSHYVTDNSFAPPQPASWISANPKSITSSLLIWLCTASVPSDPLQPDPIYFPSDPLQPYLIFFLTTRKCSVFGVYYEAIPRQIDFITDESGETGKGANAVISRLRFFYENHGLGEKDVIFMLTTVLARTRTIWWYNTWCGGLLVAGILQSITPSCATLQTADWLTKDQLWAYKVCPWLVLWAL